MTILLAPILALTLTPQVAQVEAVLQRTIEPSGRSPEATFGRVADLAVDRQGNTYVLDDRGDRVLVFSAAGDHLRTFGRSGRGPGQLNRPMRIDVRGGVVTVLNPSGQSSSFSVTGDPLSSRQLPFGAQSATRIDEQRYAVLVSATVARGDPTPIEALLRLDAERTDTVMTVPSSDILFQGPTSATALRSSLCRQAYFVVGEEEELWVASGTDGTLTEWRSVDGIPEPRRSVTLVPAGVPLPDSTRARLVSGLPRQFDPQAGDLHIPSHLSSICGLELSAGGLLWVRLADVTGRERWRAVEVETLLATREFMAPAGVQMSAFAAEMAYGIRVDQAGVPNVMAYRIQ